MKIELSKDELKIIYSALLALKEFRVRPVEVDNIEDRIADLLLDVIRKERSGGL